MKEGLVCGIVIGMIAGAMLYKNNDTAKELFNKGEKTIKKELKNMSNK